PVACGEKISSKEGAVGSQFEKPIKAEVIATTLHDVSKKLCAAMRVVDVAATVLVGQHVARLRERCEDRIVARVLPVMGIEAALGALDLQTSRQYRAINVDGPAPPLRPLRLLDDHGA